MKLLAKLPAQLEAKTRLFVMTGVGFPVAPLLSMQVAFAISWRRPEEEVVND